MSVDPVRVLGRPSGPQGCQFENLSNREIRIVTKKEIVKTISDEMQLTQLKTKEIVQKTFDAIVDTLVTERRIELRNFGVFEVKKRAARKARNPRTGERVDVEEKFVVTFKPGKEMEERVRQLEIEEAARRAESAAASQSSQTSTMTPGEQGHSATKPAVNDRPDNSNQDGLADRSPFPQQNVPLESRPGSSSW